VGAGAGADKERVVQLRGWPRRDARMSWTVELGSEWACGGVDGGLWVGMAGATLIAMDDV
jgi:hypothetical protein